jgi:WXG100 family type VII secretion target
MAVTIPQVEASRPEGLAQSATELGQKASRLASQIDKQHATLDGLRSGWEGTASDAAIAKATPTLLRMQQIHDALNRAQTVLQQGGSQLTQTRTNVLQTVSQLSGQGWQVGSDGTVSVRPGSPLDQYAKVSPVNAMKLQQLAATNSATVKALLAGFDTTDRQLSQNLRNAVTGLDAAPRKLASGVRGLSGDVPLSPQTDGPQKPDDDQRRRNQKDAFRNMFGRDPISKSDWTTAASLDPHSYEPKFHGTPPVVKVVRISPVPGQGVVRSSQWIPDRDVYSYPPGTRDLGNNRGPDPNFDPEDTKVTTTIDYDNGIVVMRQNPSVMENPDGSPGEVRCGTPAGTVTQLPDGSVRIKYDSGNPFAPEITRDPTGPFQGHEVTVNGDLVFTPGRDGVQVSGTRTDYPSMEVYQDMPDGKSHIVLIDNAAAGGPAGPMTNLPLHHDVGIGGKAFAPFDTGGWNPTYDVPTPLPGTAFGSVDNPPSAVPPPTVGVPM